MEKEIEEKEVVQVLLSNFNDTVDYSLRLEGTVKCYEDSLKVKK